MEKNMKNVLITGGAGFVGSSLAKSLENDGHKITIIDNLSTGNLDNIKDLKSKFLKLDVADRNNISIIEKEIEKSDIVYHFAASIGVKLIQEHPKDTFKNSTRINDNVFPLFEKYNKKVIFSSTSEVYGETKSKKGSCEDDVLKILPIQKPRGSYACAKLFSEFMIKSYNFPAVIIRFFNVVGPTQTSEYGHVIPRFIKQAKNNEPLTLYNDGKMIRSFCDIRDAVEMLKILLDDVHNEKVYNIGNDKNICNMRELAETVVKLCNSSSKINLIPFDEAFKGDFADIFVRYPNTDKIQKFYKCKYDLKNIISNIIGN